MDAISKGVKEKRCNNLITKTWQRCKSIGRGSKRTPEIRTPALTVKSKSWPRLRDRSSSSSSSSSFPWPLERAEKGDDEIKRRRLSKRQVAPDGCFSVYVGPQKERFFVKTEYVNHPLFRLLLEEAESEYGYNCGGPLQLPCNVDVFRKVLLAMDDDNDPKIRQGCGLVKSPTSYRLLSPSRMITINQLI